MKFAHFSHVWEKPGMTPLQRYEQLWRELQLCDSLGFDFGFAVEHHFCPDESWMSAPSIYVTAAAARTRNIRLGAMGHIIPLHHPVRLAEEIALTDQITGGRLEVGLVPGVVPDYFPPFGADFKTKREATMEYVAFLRAAYTDGPNFTFEGKFHHAERVKLSINPLQRPHPPLWLETRQPQTLEFCAREGINTGYFLLDRRADVAPRFRTYVENWTAAGWQQKPNIAYTTVVYVDRTDNEALDKALDMAGTAYRGFFRGTKTPAELKARQDIMAATWGEISYHLLDKDYLLENELILIGSPETVAKKLRAWAAEGMFNTFAGEFNFGNLQEDDLMRSIQLFGTEVIPQLRDFEPY